MLCGEESALWVGAWQHAWTRCAMKQHAWMQPSVQHYRAKPTRWWHTKLTDGLLQDPAMAVAEGISPAGLITHNSGRRLDAMLVCVDAWRICNREAYYAVDYSNAGDHLGVTMVTHSPLQESPLHHKDSFV